MTDGTMRWPGRDDNRDLFIIGNQGYDNIRTWKLIITPEEVTIIPAKTAWGCIILFNGLCLLLLAAFLYPVYLFADADRKVPGLVIATLIMCATGCVVTALTLRRFWSEQNKGPSLVVSRIRRMVSLPRHDIEVPIQQIDHLQAISGSEYEQSRSSEKEYKSELNIVIREGEQCRRYHLLGFLGPNEFDGIAMEIAKLNLFPVKCIDSVWDPRRITQKWLTPKEGF